MEGVRVHFPRKAAAAASAPSPFPHGKYEIIYRAPTDVRGKVKGGGKKKKKKEELECLYGGRRNRSQA